VTKLAEALPELVLDIETPLARLGRGELAEQLKQATLERWTYDEFADIAYLFLAKGEFEPAERLSLWDELGVNVDCDARGLVKGLEIMDGRRVADRLEK
jgi:uncharacterized protein YuzE